MLAWYITWMFKINFNTDCIQLFRERLSEKMCTRQSRKVMGYDQYTVPDDCSCRTYFCCFPLALANTFPWPFVPIFSNFLEAQRTQNHPQCLSRLSRALFPTTFLEIDVYFDSKSKQEWHFTSANMIGWTYPQMNGRTESTDDFVQPNFLAYVSI